LGYSFASNIAKNLLKIQSSNPLPIIISAFTIYFRAGSMLQIESGRFYYDKIKKVQATNLNQQKKIKVL